MPEKQYIYDCPFNKGIVCDDTSKYAKCGWNPEVEVIRKEKARKEYEEEFG